MRTLLILALFLAGPVVSQTLNTTSEPMCSYMVHAPGGGFRIAPASGNLHVLSQVMNGGEFKLPPDAPSNIANIMCLRSSPVPSKFDVSVLNAGFGLFIAAPSGRMFKLERKGESVSLTPVRGAFTDGEKAEVESVLREINQTPKN